MKNPIYRNFLVVRCSLRSLAKDLHHQLLFLSAISQDLHSCFRGLPTALAIAEVAWFLTNSPLRSRAALPLAFQ